MKLAFNETTQDYDLLEDADAADPDITKGYTDGGYKIVPVTDAQVAEIKAKPSAVGRALKAANPLAAGENPVVGPAGFGGRVLREGLVDAGGAAAGAAAGTAALGPIGTIPGGIIGGVLTATGQGVLDAAPDEERGWEGFKSGALELLTGGLGSILGNKVGKAVSKSNADEGVKKAAKNDLDVAKDASVKKPELIEQGGDAKTLYQEADEALQTLRYKPDQQLKSLQDSYVQKNSQFIPAGKPQLTPPTEAQLMSVAQKIRNGEKIVNAEEKAIENIGRDKLLEWADSVDEAAEMATQKSVHSKAKAAKGAAEAAVSGAENVAAKELGVARETQRAPGIAPKTSGAITGGVGGFLRSAVENIKKTYNDNVNATEEDLNDRYQRELAVNIGQNQEKEQDKQGVIALKKASEPVPGFDKQQYKADLDLLDYLIEELMADPSNIELQKAVVEQEKNTKETLRGKNKIKAEKMLSRTPDFANKEI